MESGEAIFETKRMQFFRPQEPDLKWLGAWIEDPLIMKFQGGPWTGERNAEFLEFVEWHWDRFKFGHYIAKLKPDLTPVGVFSLKYLKKDPNLDIEIPDLGFSVAPEYWGRGLATEGVLALANHAFTELGFHEIEALNYLENEASKKVLQRTGFQEQGLVDVIYNGRKFGSNMKWVKTRGIR